MGRTQTGARTVLLTEIAIGVVLVVGFLISQGVDLLKLPCEIQSTYLAYSPRSLAGCDVQIRIALVAHPAPLFQI